jgi:hypothetical protein
MVLAFLAELREAGVSRRKIVAEEVKSRLLQTFGVSTATRTQQHQRRHRQAKAWQHELGSIPLHVSNSPLKYCLNTGDLRISISYSKLERFARIDGFSADADQRTILKNYFTYRPAFGHKL